MSNIKYIVASLLVLSPGFAFAVNNGPDKENLPNYGIGSAKFSGAAKTASKKALPLPGLRIKNASSDSDSEPSKRKRDPRDGSPKKSLPIEPCDFKTPKRSALVHRETPVTLSIAEMSPVRRKFLSKGYTKSGERKAVSRSVMERILDEHLPDYPHVKHDGERVYLNMRLFDFEHTFLAQQGGEVMWETNRQRMARGVAPLCYRAYLDPKVREGMTVSEIENTQKGWSIELHHLTLDMQGYGILMLVRGLHMGGEASYLVNFDGEDIKIVRSRLSRKDKEELKVEQGYKIVSNVLHPANGKSQIDRGRFDTWRTSFWKALATGEIDIPETENDFFEDVVLEPLAPEKIQLSASRYGAFMNTRGGVVQQLAF